MFSRVLLIVELRVSRLSFSWSFPLLVLTATASPTAVGEEGSEGREASYRFFWLCRGQSVLRACAVLPR